MQAGYTSIRDGELIVILSLSITVIEREDGSVEAHAEDESAFGDNRDEAMANDSSSVFHSGCSGASI